MFENVLLDVAAESTFACAELVALVRKLFVVVGGAEKGFEAGGVCDLVKALLEDAAKA